MYRLYEVARKGLFFGITGITWLVSIPILNTFFLPQGFYFLQGFMILIWLAGSISWAIILLLYVVRSRMHGD